MLSAVNTLKYINKMPLGFCLVKLFSVFRLVALLLSFGFLSFIFLARGIFMLLYALPFPNDDGH